jgi:hypothetical protein
MNWSASDSVRKIVEIGGCTLKGRDFKRRRTLFSKTYGTATKPWPLKTPTPRVFPEAGQSGGGNFLAPPSMKLEPSSLENGRKLLIPRRRIFMIRCEPGIMRNLAMRVRTLCRILLGRRRGLDDFDFKVHGQLFRRVAGSLVAGLIS